MSPQRKARGLAVVHNPLDRRIERNLILPLYYTGLTNTVSVRERTGQAAEYTLDRRYNVTIPLEMGPRSTTWFLVEESPVRASRSGSRPGRCR